jgi:hypothetical protein
MNEQMSEVANLVASKDPAITGRGLFEYGQDIKKRATLPFVPNDVGQQQQQAPQSALDYLKTHPEFKEQFRTKYGYLPEGM